MTNPNDTQVGGNHYRGTERQHWDYMLAIKANYFQGQITRYLWRYGKKDGEPALKDLQKTLHYCHKYKTNTYPPFMSEYTVQKLLSQAYEDNGWGPYGERVQAIEAVLQNDIRKAIMLIGRLIKEEKASEPNSAYTNQG